MRKQAIALTPLAAMMMTVIWVVAPHVVISLNEAGTDVVGVDIVGLSSTATDATDFSAQARAVR
jgi:hypothetical protein